MVRKNKCGNDNRMNAHTSQNDLSGFSYHQRVKNMLGGYHCHLTTMKKMDKTSIEENLQIEELNRYIESGCSDPELMLEKIRVMGVNLIP